MKNLQFSGELCKICVTDIENCLLKYITSRAVAVTKWSSEPSIEVDSNKKTITLRPILSKLVFLYYIFSS